MVSKGQAGLPRRLFSSTTRRGKPGPACNPPPQGQPATQDGLQGRPAPSLPCACYAPCLPQGKCDLCRFHGLSRLKIKTVRPLGPAKVGCRGSQRGLLRPSAPQPGPRPARGPRAWLISQGPGRDGQGCSGHRPLPLEPLPLVCLPPRPPLARPAETSRRHALPCPMSCGPRGNAVLAPQLCPP